VTQAEQSLWLEKKEISKRTSAWEARNPHFYRQLGQRK
jgi:hypothetical protein